MKMRQSIGDKYGPLGTAEEERGRLAAAFQRKDALQIENDDLRERLAVREEQVKRLRRALHAFGSTLGGAQNAARQAAHLPFEDVRRELREDADE